MDVVSICRRAIGGDYEAAQYLSGVDSAALWGAVCAPGSDLSVGLACARVLSTRVIQSEEESPIRAMWAVDLLSLPPKVYSVLFGAIATWCRRNWSNAAFISWIASDADNRKFLNFVKNLFPLIYKDNGIFWQLFDRTISLIGADPLVIDAIFALFQNEKCHIINGKSRDPEIKPKIVYMLNTIKEHASTEKMVELFSIREYMRLSAVYDVFVSNMFMRTCLETKCYVRWSDETFDHFSRAFNHFSLYSDYSYRDFLKVYAIHLEESICRPHKYFAYINMVDMINDFLSYGGTFYTLKDGIPTIEECKMEFDQIYSRLYQLQVAAALAERGVSVSDMGFPPDVAGAVAGLLRSPSLERVQDQELEDFRMMNTGKYLINCIETVGGPEITCTLFGRCAGRPAAVASLIPFVLAKRRRSYEINPSLDTCIECAIESVYSIRGPMTTNDEETVLGFLEHVVTTRGEEAAGRCVGFVLSRALTPASFAFLEKCFRNTSINMSRLPSVRAFMSGYSACTEVPKLSHKLFRCAFTVALRGDSEYPLAAEMSKVDSASPVLSMYRLLGAVQAAKSGPSYESVFGLLLPRRAALSELARCGVDSVIVPLLRVMGALCDNEGGRISFGKCGPNTIHLVHWAADVLKALPSPPSQVCAPHVLRIVTNCIDGGFVNFKMMEFFGDTVLSDLQRAGFAALVATRGDESQKSKFQQQRFINAFILRNFDVHASPEALEFMMTQSLQNAGRESDEDMRDSAISTLTIIAKRMIEGGGSDVWTRLFAPSPSSKLTILSRCIEIVDSHRNEASIDLLFMFSMLFKSSLPLLTRSTLFVSLSSSVEQACSEAPEYSAKNAKDFREKIYPLLEQVIDYEMR
jgi:hypothetical protein